MKKYIKIFLIFSIVTFIIICVKFYYETQDMKELKKILIKNETKSLSALIMAFRNTYQDIFINKNILITEKTIHLLPVKTTEEIAQKFSKILNDKVIIRTVSNRPRNPNNLANKKEMEIIDYFEKNKKKNTFFQEEKNFTFYYAKPLYITQSCLSCHGKREDAVKTIRENYDTAYNYKLGELRGIVSIKVTKKDVIKNINNYFYRNFQIAIFVYLLFLLAIYLMIRIIIKNEKKYATTLEEKVLIQVKRLRHQDNILLQQSKMAEIGEMIGNIAHQWRQPLSIISTSASGIKLKNEFGKLDNEFINYSVDNIVTTTQYLSQTIDDFRNFIKNDKEKVLFTLENNISKNLKILNATLKYYKIEVLTKIDKTVSITSYPNELTQVFINIINNAKDAFNEKNIMNRDIFIDIIQDNDYIIIYIKDNAGGINSSIIDKIFDPYFTTKHQSQGTGLGLYMTHRIITESLSGTIEVQNVDYTWKDQEYTGALFTIKIPTLI